jgi:hypothetical protein
MLINLILIAGISLFSIPQSCDAALNLSNIITPHKFKKPISEFNLGIVIVKCEGSHYETDIPDMEKTLITNTMNQLADNFKSCSNKKGYLNLQKSAIYGPIYINCSSIIPSDSNCEDYFLWDYYINQKLNNSSIYKIINNHDLTGVIVPPEFSICPIGWGVVGEGRFWLKPSNMGDANLYMHEIGHNFGLEHASKGTCEYCDMSSAMGYCCSVRCYNAPQTDWLGWNDKAMYMDTSQMQTEKWYKYYISATPTAYLKINTNLFVSYRWAEGNTYDKDLTTPYVGNVLVHHMEESQPNSYLLATLGTEDNIYVDEIYIKTIKINDAKGAYFNICKSKNIEDCKEWDTTPEIPSGIQSNIIKPETSGAINTGLNVVMNILLAIMLMVIY